MRGMINTGDKGMREIEREGGNRRGVMHRGNGRREEAGIGKMKKEIFKKIRKRLNGDEKKEVHMKQKQELK